MQALKVLGALKEGNQRFVAGHSRMQALASQQRREAVADRQTPVAVILGCSDSRVPAEIIFDQGLGDLFVIRVAGNIVAPSQMGSVEFAIEQFGVELVVVLGHSHCGAVAATIDNLLASAMHSSEYLESIVSHIRPAVEPLINSHTEHNETFKRQAVQANVRASVNRLKTGSEILARSVAKNNLLIVGAEYSLDTGLVAFLD